MPSASSARSGKSGKSGSGPARRRALVEQLEKTGAIRTAAVRRAFLRVPRERFVPEIAGREGLARVYANEALVIRMASGGGPPTSSSSQPSIMAEMLERLELRPGLRVLEIGAGTGYNAALLSTLVGPSGRVTSVELQWDLADKAARALREGGYPVEVLVGDAQHGRFGNAPYDRIILTASTDHVAPVWVEQLAGGGLIEMPLRLGPPGPYQQLVVTFRREDDRLRTTSIVWGGFMNLRSAGDGGVEQQPPTISVHEVVDGTYRSFGSLVGAGLATLDPDARRRLAGLLAAEPASRRSFPAKGAKQSLLPYVSLAEPSGGVVVSQFGERPAVGIASLDGRSMALALPVGAKPDRCEVLSYGTGGAGLLDEEIARWRKAGRPSLGDWSIEVAFGDAAPAGDRVFRRRDCWIAVSR